MRSSLRSLALPVLSGLLVASSADTSASANVTFSGTSGDLAASANFSQSGSNLTIVLTNTSLSDVLVPANVLTAVFFDITAPALSLGRTSAVLTPGSTVLFGSTDPGNVVGGEWAYRSGLVGAPGSAAYGIGSAGFDLFGPGDRFPGNDLFPPANVNGLEYGITSAGDNPATGNTPVTGTQPLIQNSVTFTLSGLPANFQFSRISNVRFQYGTDTASEPSFEGFVPAPGISGFLAIAAITSLRRRRV